MYIEIEMKEPPGKRVLRLILSTIIIYICFLIILYHRTCSYIFWQLNYEQNPFPPINIFVWPKKRVLYTLMTHFFLNTSNS